MESDLLKLKISESELEKLSGIATDEVVTSNLYWHFSKDNLPKISSVILHQLVIFVLTLIISCPLGLIMVSKTNYSPEDPQSMVLFWQIAAALSLIMTISWNVYMWLKTKPLVSLANLLEEVQKYNQAIKAVDIIDKFVEAGNLNVSLMNRQETIKALTVTREGLICALKTEKIIRENQDLMAKQSELFLNLENNFSTLMSYQLSDRVDEYGRLLNQALEIGTTVHKEILKLQNRIN
jgi:hypothetical protein